MIEFPVWSVVVHPTRYPPTSAWPSLTVALPTPTSRFLSTDLSRIRYSLSAISTPVACYKATAGQYLNPRVWPSWRFPDVALWFGEAKVRWFAKYYLARHIGENQFCYAFEDGTEMTLGASFMLNVDMIFDMEGGRVGMAGAECPEHRARATKSAPAATASTGVVTGVPTIRGPTVTGQPSHVQPLVTTPQPPLNTSSLAPPVASVGASKRDSVAHGAEGSPNTTANVTHTISANGVPFIQADTEVASTWSSNLSKEVTSAARDPASSLAPSTTWAARPAAGREPQDFSGHALNAAAPATGTQQPHSTTWVARPATGHEHQDVFPGHVATDTSPAAGDNLHSHSTTRPAIGHEQQDVSPGNAATDTSPAAGGNLHSHSTTWPALGHDQPNAASGHGTTAAGPSGGNPHSRSTTLIAPPAEGHEHQDAFSGRATTAAGPSGGNPHSRSTTLIAPPAEGHEHQDAFSGRATTPAAPVGWKSAVHYLGWTTSGRA